jgi:hypothetical protein
VIASPIKCLLNIKEKKSNFTKRSLAITPFFKQSKGTPPFIGQTEIPCHLIGGKENSVTLP